MAAAVPEKRDEKFRCRRCRLTLFTIVDISETHDLNEACNSWFLREDEEILPWVLKLIDEAGWTEGKLYCPKCNARVGGFDFLHVVQCSCDNDVIPAIWCPKSKVDHVKKLESKYDMNRVMHGEKLKEGQENVTISDLSHQAFDGEKTQNFAGKSKGGSPIKHCKTSKILMHTKNHNVKTQSKSMERRNLIKENDIVDTKVLDICQNYVEEMCASPLDVKNPIQSNTNHGSKSCHQPVNCCCNQFKVMQCLEPSHPPTRDKFTQCSGGNIWGDATALPIEDTEGHHIFANIHHDLEEVREEVICFTGYHKDKNQRSESSTLFHDAKTQARIARKNRKPRRRGRCNWQSEQFFLESSRGGFEYHPEDSSKYSKAVIPKKPKKEKEKELELSDSEIPECYKCAICLSLLYEPHKTPCSHVFCGLCLRHLNSVTSGRPKCPLCRDPILSVASQTEYEQEIQESFPANYRRRAREERKNRYRKSPLPSAASTFFDTLPAGREQSMFMNLINHISIAAMIISLILNSILVNANRLDQAERRSLIKRAIFIAIAIIGIVAIIVVSVFLLIFAVDFFKIALFIVGSYIAISKFLLRTLID